MLHHLLTGEHEGYYADFADQPTLKMARCLGEGFIYQGEQNRRGHTRGEPSAHLPTSSFVLFLQNHDQIGNRAFGERLTTLAEPDALRAATALMLLSPMVPLLFMGEEWGSRQPFLYFTDHNDELAQAVREGRQKEFSEFALFAGEGRATVPDPNAVKTFTSSRPDFAASTGQPEFEPWRQLYRDLLRLRRERIIPRLQSVRSLGVKVLADNAVSAEWELADGARLRIDINLSEAFVASEPAPAAAQELFVHRVDAQVGMLSPNSVMALLETRL